MFCLTTPIFFVFAAMLPTGPPSLHGLHTGQGRPSEANGWSREHAAMAPGGWAAQQSEEILEEENVRLSDDLRHRTLRIQPGTVRLRGFRERGIWGDGDFC